MRCPMCAETIQDQAKLCRFCGARLVDGTWVAPQLPMAAKKQPTSFTVVSSGWLLLISGVFGIITCGGSVPLFGAVRSGPVAVAYNLLMAAPFLWMGAGLAFKKPFAMQATWVASAVYSLDKVLYLLDSKARAASMAESSQMLGSLGLDGSILDQASVAAAFLFLLGWWGLVAVVWAKRSIFVVQ